MGLDRGSKFSNTEILERETNDASLDATVETRRENKEKEKNSLGKKDYAMIMLHNELSIYGADARVKWWNRKLIVF